jgi:tetratricopeptide (TPR) repeat protein
LKYKLLFIVFISTLSHAQINVSHFIFQGKQAIVNNEFNIAIDFFSQVINARPDLYEPYFLRALSKYSLSDFKGAEIDLNKAIEMKPNYPEALLYRGICREKMMNFTEALSDFDKALVLEPFSAELYVSKAFTKTMLEEHSSAIELCDKAIKIDKKYERAYLCRAWNKFRIFDVEGSLADYDKSIQLNKYNDDTFAKRGMVKAFMLNYNGAMDDFNEALKIDSTNIHTWYQLGHVQKELGDLDNALHSFNKMIVLDPHSALGFFERAELENEFGEVDKAIEDYSMVIVLSKGHLLSYFNRGSLYFDLGKYAASIEDFTQAIEIYPEFAEAYFNRALSYSRIGMHGMATVDMEKATAIKNSLYQLDEQGQQKELKKVQELATIKDDFEGSDARFGRIQNKSVEINWMPDFIAIPMKWVPDSLKSQTALFTSPPAWPQIKTTFLSHEGWIPQNYSALLDELNDLLAKDPENFEVLFQQGVLFQLIENYELAYEAYSAALAFEPNRPEILLNRAVVKGKMLVLTESMGNLPAGTTDGKMMNYEIAKNQQVVINDLDKILLQYPSFVPAQYNLANLYASTGRLSEALRLLTESIEIRSELGPLHFNKALALIYLGNTEEACKYLSTAGQLGVLNAYPVIKKYCQ